MKLEKFNTYLVNEALKSTIVKRLQKEPNTRSRYKDGKYVDVTEYRQTRGFEHLRNYYDLEKIDDTYFKQITQEQARKKPYNNDHDVYCFKNGKFLGYFNGTHVVDEHGGRRNREAYSRKGIIDSADELWVFDEVKAKKEATRGLIGKTRQDARDTGVSKYLGGTNHHNKYNDKGLNAARKAHNDEVKKDNINRYYQSKSKNLDFSDVYDLLQIKLKKAYKKIAHAIEESKHLDMSQYHSIKFGNSDPVLALIIQKIGYDKDSGDIINIQNILKRFHDLMKDFFKMKEKGENVYSYSHNSTPANEELINKLKFIQYHLRKSEEPKESES